MKTLELTSRLLHGSLSSKHGLIVIHGEVSFTKIAGFELL
ncbi:Uncharacterised protein [Vibrio cholerae]|nr:Uncharacterised protein [Vibrio cholerae]CSD41283.1 Uncharacterised protein [Vibrio cholerae]